MENKKARQSQAMKPQPKYGSQLEIKFWFLAIQDQL
jgi:hypothetical protein